MKARPQPLALGVALGLALALVVAVDRANAGAWRPLAQLVVGLALGATLLATDFGFAGAFRRLVVAGDASGLRAHLFTFAIAMALVVPMLAAGEVLGAHVEGIAHGIGVTFLIGGALFGVGMQLAGGCASGTLYQLGGGSAKYAGALAGFVFGSVLAAWHLERWWGWPALPPLTLFTLGPWPLTLALALGAMVLALGVLDRAWPPRPVLIGGALLAILNAATLVVSGRPWSETWAFTVWGAQIAAGLGAHPQGWPIFRESAYDVSPFVERTSITDLAIPLGAWIAAAALGRFELRRAPARAWVAATVGGVLMGYGARLSGGCNIGAYFSAIASGDLSGWAWALAALGGSAVGVRWRARIEGDGARVSADSTPAEPDPAT